MSFQAPNALTETPIIWCLGERLCSKSQGPIACVIHKLINSFIHHSFFIHSSFILHSSLSHPSITPHSSISHPSSPSHPSINHSSHPYSFIHQSLLPSILLHPLHALSTWIVCSMTSHHSSLDSFVSADSQYL